MSVTPDQFFSRIEDSVVNRLTGEVSVYRSLHNDTRWQSFQGADALDVILRSLQRSIALGMGRLFDPAVSAGKKTMSLRALEKRIREDDENGQLADAINQFFVDNEDVVDRLRRVRNWYLAHLDAEMYLGNVDLPSLSHDDLESLFDSIDALLNMLSSAFHDSCSFYGEIGMSRGDGGVLIKCLAKGDQYYKLMSDLNSNMVGSDNILPRILRDHGLSHHADRVESGCLDGFPAWQ